MSSRILILVPTPLELDLLQRIGRLPEDDQHRVELCGFGVAAAAARTAQLAAPNGWSRILLVGVAGTFDEDRLPVGAAEAFGTVSLDGIHTGGDREDEDSESPTFRQWPGSTDSPAISETIHLDDAPPEAPGLLTVCAASASAEQAQDRRARFQAAAEDMEGFGVALAARLCGIPLTIVRGISNRCGDRDRRGWKLREALDAARATLVDTLARLEVEEP